MKNGEKGFGTLCAHGGTPKKMKVGESHVKPLYQNSVFDFPSIETSLPALEGKGYVYRRNGTPNANDFGCSVAALEGAESALATTSGMAAIAAATFATTKAGDLLFIQSDAYGGTRDFFKHDAARLGLRVKAVDIFNEAALRSAFEANNDVSTLMIETISNPLLRLANISMISKLCNEFDTKLIVDNTFATPFLCRPLLDGAHLVIHSATKFLGGHHDLSAGVIVGSSELIAEANGPATRLGLRAAPLDAWLALRGLRTLKVRMQYSGNSAAELAIHMADQKLTVYSAAGCAMISFDLLEAARAHRFVKALEWIPISPSLGGVTTTLSHPATSSHRSLSPEERHTMGIGDGLLRLSVGLEEVSDIWEDLRNALEKTPVN